MRTSWPMGSSRARASFVVLTVCLALLGSATRSVSHPHDEPDLFDADGTLTKVDVARQFIEIDVFDKKTKTTRNLLLFIVPKAKIRNGKTRVGILELRPGQRVRCTIVREHPEDREDLERLVVHEIRLA